MIPSQLEKIVEHKRHEIKEKKSLYPEKLLQKSIFFETTAVSLKKYLLRQDLNGIIAEFKRQSPSRGMINEFASVETTTLGYMQAGASALSVLTDNKFFGGSNEDLSLARKFNFCPILRKDFIIDPYQIIEAKSIGADAILLIAALLSKNEIIAFSELAHSLGLEVLLELHGENEMDKITSSELIVGVNNRNLHTMTTDVETSLHMAEILPNELVKVAESGLKDAQTIQLLKEKGYHGFLIGEFFMQHARPEKACKKLIQSLRVPISC